jgi:hypothetical protein
MDVIGPIPFIFNAITEGKSATEALSEYRAGGGAIRTQRFYQAYGEVAAEVAVLPDLQAQPVDTIPSGELIRQRASSRPGAYLARVGVLVSQRTVDPLTGKVSEVTQVNWGSVRMQELSSIEEILALGEENFGPSGQSGLANSTVIGSVLGPVEELVEL